MDLSTKKLIENYLLERLEPSEREAVAARLKTEPEWQAELKAQQLLLEQVEAMGDLEMKRKLLEIKEKVQLKKNARAKHRRLRRWMAAAAILAGLALGYWVFFGQPDTSELYMAYYEPYSIPLTSRDAGSAPEMARLGKLYRDKNFAEALPLTGSLLRTYPDDSRLLLARGICQLELGQLENSLNSFNLLLENNDPLYEDQARWYSALAFLKKDNVPACQELLKQMAGDPQAFYHEKAKKLLRKLQ